MKKHATKSSLGYWLSRSARKLDKFFENYLSDLNLTSNEYAILNSVYNSESTTPSEIVSFLNMDKGYVTRQVVNLEKKGLIKRVDNKKDRRSYSLKLTNKGENILPELIECSFETNRQLKSLLTEKEQMSLLKILQKVGNSDI
jgi:DNA-binding MarR family transcriptional regulator